MDLASLPGWVADAGAAAFIGLSMAMAIMRGWLVPGRTVDRLIEAERAAAAAERARAEEWKAVAQAATAQAEMFGAQAGTLTTEMATQTALLRSIREWAARRRDES